MRETADQRLGGFRRVDKALFATDPTNPVHGVDLDHQAHYLPLVAQQGRDGTVCNQGVTSRGGEIDTPVGIGPLGQGLTVLLGDEIQLVGQQILQRTADAACLTELQHGLGRRADELQPQLRVEDQDRRAQVVENL